MVGTLRGIKKVEFKNDKGETVSGRRLYIKYEDETVTGVACDSKYFDDNSKIVLPDLVLNHKYDFVYECQGFSGKASLVAVKKL